MSKPPPLKVFITYSHNDLSQKEKLKEYLAVMEQNGEITAWDDNQILPSDEWEKEIATYLAISDILLYLVSAKSLASKNCNKELAEALQKDKKVIPIVLEDCDWEQHRLSKFEVLPNKGKAINEWTPESKGWQNVVAGIRKTVNKSKKSKIESPTNERAKIKNTPLLLLEQANLMVMLGQLDQAIQLYSEVIKLGYNLLEGL